MVDYLDLYKTILEVFRDNSPRDMHQLMHYLQQTKLISDALSKQNNLELSRQTVETVDNLLEDGLIKGKRVPTKDLVLYNFFGLTTAGYQYLDSVKVPGFKERLLKTLQSEGIPLSPQNITKFITKLFIR